MRTIRSLLVILSMSVVFAASAHAEAAGTYSTGTVTATEAGAEYFDSTPQEPEDPETFEGADLGSGEEADDPTGETGGELSTSGD